MNLYRVAITGADDSISPEDLVPLQMEFPFAEWAILLSNGRAKSPRYPSVKWMEHLAELALEEPSLQLAGHLCGRWVRDLMEGNFSFPVTYPHLVDVFDRFQINFHAIKHEVARAPLVDVIRLHGDKEFIFQIDDVNDDIFHRAWMADLNVSALFDTSHGFGVLRESWPKPIEGAVCGYAGGLGPDNLEAELPKIAEAAGNAKIWIDMETKVRSDDDRQFDLAKVRRCLEIARPFVSPWKAD